MSFGWSGMSGEGTMMVSAGPTVRHPLDLRSLGSSKNYEDSVRRRYEMEQQVAKKDSTAKRLMMESDKIKKMLE